MTPDELKQLILRAKDGWQLQAAFATLDKGARAKLSSTAQQIHRQLHRGEAVETNPIRNFLSPPPKAGGGWNHKAMRHATLAIFALGPISTLKKEDATVRPQDLEIFDRIIRDRRPDWLDDWVLHELQQQPPKMTFPILRGWIQDGLCRKPDVDRYYRVMARYLMPYGTNDVPISQRLLEDPDLLEDVPRLIRVGAISFDAGRNLRETWNDALITLVNQGHLDRTALLDLAVDALMRDLSAAELAGLPEFYSRLGPDKDALARHQPFFIDLLGHRVGPVVALAIDMLSEIEKLGMLDTTRLGQEACVVFSSMTKGHALAALRLIQRALSRSQGTDAHALRAACDALHHKHADVQASALAILEAHAPRLAESHIDALQSTGAYVSASNRSRLSMLVAATQTRGSEDGAAERQTLYQPLSRDPDHQTVLSPEDALVPIASVDELIEAISHAIELVESPDEIERIIDGISRLAHDRPADLEARVAPLLYRLRSREPSKNSLVTGNVGVSAAVCALVRSWLTGRRHRALSWGDPYQDAFAPQMAHLSEVAKRVVRKESLQLLSAPTHKGGWIDPLVWVERLRTSPQPDRLAETIDFGLSLVRLAPDNRRAALDRAMALPAPLHRIAGFALGGDARPEKGDHFHYPAWICAARCRAPHHDWSRELAALDIHDAWPDGLKPARYQWLVSLLFQKGDPTRTSATLTVSVKRGAGEAPPPPPKRGLLDRLKEAIGAPTVTNWRTLPTVALSSRITGAGRQSPDMNAPWVARWLTYVWPQNPAGALMIGAVRLTARLDANSSTTFPNFAFLDALFQRDIDWGEPAHLLLCLGLLGKDADVKGLAVDALIEGIDGRRFDPALFAATLTRLAEGAWLKLHRLGDALMPLVQLSETHAAAICQTLQQGLPGLDLQQKGISSLLEVLVEARASAGQALQPEARDALGGLTGSGKSAKLAKRLLDA